MTAAESPPIPTHGSTAGAAGNWIGIPPTRLQIVAILIVSVIGSLMPSILPILLDGLVQEGRLTEVTLGRTAMAELLAIGIVAGAACIWLPHRNVRRNAFGAALLIVIANLATIPASGIGVTLARMLSGLGCAMFVWVLVGLLLRSGNAARLIGIYVVLLASSALGLSSLFSGWLVPSYGINGGFVALAIIGGAVALLSLLLPNSYAELPAAVEGHNGVVPPFAGVMAVITQFLFVAGLLAVWVYVGTLARQTGISPGGIALAFQLAFVGQIAGGLAAAWIANRFAPFWVVASSGAIAAGLSVLFLTGSSETGFIASATAFGALWMFTAPYLLPFAVACDPGLRAAAIATPAQLIGSAIGPALASLAVTAADVSGATWTAIALFLAAILAAATGQIAARKGEVVALN